MNHILTPFSRTFNLIELGNAIKNEGCEWHLLCVEGEFKLPYLGSWVHQYFFRPPEDGRFIGHHLVNEFLDNVAVQDDDYYNVQTDDDMPSPGLFKQLAQYSDDIIIVSMQRSNVPTEGTGTCAFDTLVAAPENIKVGSVGFEQLIIKGKVLKEYRCGARYEADGDLIMKLWDERMESFRFVPDAFVYFDKLPPGMYKCSRWCR